MGAPQIWDRSRPKRRGRHTVDSLIADIGDGPLLTAEEERGLGRTIRSSDAPPDRREAAIRELMDRNVRLVLDIAKRCCRRGEDIGDLVSMGAIGLRRAAERYDPERGCRFATMATAWIYRAIQTGRIESGDGHPFVIPSYIYVLRQKASALRDRLKAEGREVSLEESARLTKISGRSRSAAFLGRLDVTSSGGGALDNMPSSRSVAPYRQVDTDERLEVALRFMRRLDGRSQLMLAWYLGIEERPPGVRQTYAAIGRRFDVTKERARQIITRALEDMKQWAREEDACS